MLEYTLMCFATRNLRGGLATFMNSGEALAT